MLGQGSSHSSIGSGSHFDALKGMTNSLMEQGPIDMMRSKFSEKREGMQVEKLNYNKIN